MKKHEKKQVALYLKKQHISWLKKEKKATGKTGNAILLEIIEQYMEANQ